MYETIALAKKVTVNTMGIAGNELKKLVSPGKKAIPVAEVLAIVDGVEKKASRFDETKVDIRFLGRFEGTNLLSGEVVRAAQAFFPKSVEEWLLKYYESQKEKQGKTAKAEGKEAGNALSAIGFTITVQHDPHPQSAQGYKYGCLAVVDSEVDPFAQIRAERKRLLKK